MKKKILAFFLSAAMIWTQAVPGFAEEFEAFQEEADMEGFCSTAAEEENDQTAGELAVLDEEIQDSIEEKEPVFENGIEEETQFEENLETEDELYDAGNSISNASGISTGLTYTGTISNSNTQNYYRFALSSSGRITLTATAQMENVEYYIYDSSGNQVWNTSPWWNSTSEIISTSKTIDLTKGTYYFAVKKNTAYGNYSFKLSFSSANESFTETGNGTNNSMNTASGIFTNTSYAGQIAKNDDKDFYRFTLNKSGRVNIKTSAAIEWIYYYIYDSSGKQIWKKWHSWNNTTNLISTDEIIDLTAGTYYFTVGKYSSSYTGNYSFRLDYSAAGESFAESGNGTDNSISKANSIALNTVYNGQIAKNDEKDFYQFTVNSSGKITLNISAGIDWISYYLYDASGRQVWENWAAWNSTTEKIDKSEEIELSGGTYYLAIERYGSDYTGNYSFSLRTHVHVFKDEVTKATTTYNGSIVSKCACGVVKSIQTIYYPKTISLSCDRYTYNGKTKTPSVTVRGSDGRVISSSAYTVSYSSGRKNVGKYYVGITFKGMYRGSVTKAFTIVPKGTSISKLYAKSKGFAVKIKKQTKQTSGYQVQYSTSSKFSKRSTKTITRNSVTSATYKGLKGKKKYYVRVRTYKTVSGQKYYSSWSAAKPVKTKK